MTSSPPALLRRNEHSFSDPESGQTTSDSRRPSSPPRYTSSAPAQSPEWQSPDLDNGWTPSLDQGLDEDRDQSKTFLEHKTTAYLPGGMADPPLPDDRRVPPPRFARPPPLFFGRNPGTLKAWCFEFLSATFALSCLVAMVVTLSRIDGQTLSSWPLPVVSPNAVVSILSTAAKVSMILPVAESISQLKWIYLEKRALSLNDLQSFDDASRGPWGALMFFFSTRGFWRGGAAFITYVGCIVTIAALALDPFAQQILSYPERPTLVDGTRSTVARSQTYDNYIAGLGGVSATLVGPRDGAMEAAAIAGLYDLIADPPFRCPGSNCTYPAFTSLGVRSSCADVTAHTLRDCRTNNLTMPIHDCNYTLPTGYVFGARSYMSAHSGFTHTTFNSSLNNTLMGRGSDDANLGQVGMIRFGNEDMADGVLVTDSWTHQYRAYECNFTLVAYLFDGWATRNGTIRPGVFRPYALNQSGPGPMIPYTALDDSLPGNKTFLLSFFDLGLIGSFFSDFFDPLDFQTKQPGRFWPALYVAPDLPRTMDNIARGMTYRLLSGPNATAVHGEVFASQTYIRVHWSWLVLMAVLVSVACAFFLAVVLETKWLGQRAWKSSLAPMLYGGEDILLGARGSRPSSAEGGASGLVGGGGVADRDGSASSVDGFKMARTHTIVSHLK